MVSEEDGDSLNSQEQHNLKILTLTTETVMGLYMKLTYERALSSEVNFVCAYDHPYFHHMEKIKPELFSLWRLRTECMQNLFVQCINHQYVLYITTKFSLVPPLLKMIIIAETCIIRWCI